MVWDDIEGWFSEQDANFVSDICANIKNGMVVELGLFAGRSTAVMAPICLKNNTHYYAIDNFRGSANPKDEATQHQQKRDMKALFEFNMKSLNILSSIHVVQMDSSVSAHIFNDGKIDFCFIDADHSPNAVQKDISAWWPKIRNGGIIGGHDYPSPLQSVVNQFAKERGVDVITGGRCWAIKRK